jgi:eukaryotic-like serine/threonine-protein kinase
MQPGLGIDARTWLRVNPLLDAALETPPAEREAWLAGLPAQHDDLRALLRTLLGRASRVDNAALLEALPAMDTTDDGAAHAAQHSAGELIGPYRLLRELGAGGMGAVWLAERADGLMAQRHVALKLPFVAAGPFHGDLAARIAREREILATLDHPHIARLYDAGMAANGQPFLALEHVDGQRIDHYCAQHKLGIRARLGLFLQVARAVAHAHAQLIVHRDLKPSNLLVDAAGQVKLLDFGIARLLDDGVLPAHDLTQQGARVLTPDYAAPEQIDGQPVGTRSDVYSLGVLLFELLCGQRPYRLKRASRAALEDAILHADASRPSDVATDAATRRALRGDLDTIVLKALKKPLAERYASVDALADDIERHVASRPVLARPDALGYRWRKFIVRNRFVVGAAAALLVTVLAGAGAASWQAREAGLQRDAALQAQQRAERDRSAARRAERAATAQTELSGFLMMEMASSRSNDELAAVLERARRMFDAQYRNDPALRGHVLLRIGFLFNGRGDIARSQSLWAEAEPLLREHAQWSALAELQCFRATELARRGNLDGARSMIAESAQLLARADEPSVVTQRDCLMQEAIVERTAGNAARAVVLLEQAVDGERRAGRSEQAVFVELLNTLVRSYYDAGRYRDVVQAARAASASITRLGLERTSHQETASALEAMALREGGRPLDALALLKKSGSEGTNVRLSMRVQYATTLQQLQRLDGFLALLDGLLVAARAQDVGGVDRAIRLLQVQTLADLGRWREAREPLAEAEALFAPLRKERRYNARAFSFVRAHWALAADDLAQAQEAVDEARAIVVATAQRDDPAWHRVHHLQARVHLAHGRAAEALGGAEEALALSQRRAIEPEASLTVAEDLLLRARALHALGQRDAARADSRTAQRHAEAAAGADHPLVARARSESLR